MRLDKYLVDFHYFSSREKAAFAIKKGQVFVNGLSVKKSSFDFDETKDELSIQTDEVLPYVSKGGLKLEKAIRDFKLDFEKARVLDVGSSTGGFTDCALQNGASHVTAVDVGTNQMEAALRSHPKVLLYEQTDFRDLVNLPNFSFSFDYVLSDLSFISIHKLLPFLPNFMNDDTCFVGLIKPQFEVGKDAIGRDGVVKSPDLHVKVIEEIIQESKRFNLFLHALSFAPLYDKKKNIEYLMMLTKQKTTKIVSVKTVVYEAVKLRSLL